MLKKVILVLLVLTSVFGIYYVNDYYHADMDMINDYIDDYDISMSYDNSDNIVFSNNSSDKGFIFYPGGKVDYKAYIPLMMSIASKGVTCILVKMPLNLAVLDYDAAKDIVNDYDIDEWYIGGHSLGGAMAASYVDQCDEKYSGLVLLGAYSSSDLSDCDIDVLMVYGSEDQVMNYDKYEEYKDNVPDDYSEYIIDGGNHAYFGMYGKQDQDGDASISNDKQIDITAKLIIDTIYK